MESYYFSIRFYEDVASHLANNRPEDAYRLAIRTCAYPTVTRHYLGNEYCGLPSNLRVGYEPVSTRIDIEMEQYTFYYAILRILIRLGALHTRELGTQPSDYNADRIHITFIDLHTTDTINTDVITVPIVPRHLVEEAYQLIIRSTYYEIFANFQGVGARDPFDFSSMPNIEDLHPGNDIGNLPGDEYL